MFIAFQGLLGAMLKLLIVKALVGAVYTQSSPLPEVDLGYEVHQAAGFNVSELKL